MAKSSKAVETVAVANQFEKARGYAQKAADHGFEAMANATLCGAELCRLYQEHEVKVGRPSKTKLPHGVVITEWPEIVKRELGFSDETARRWMSLARKVLADSGWVEGQALDEGVEQAVFKQLKGLQKIEGSVTQKLLMADTFGAVKWHGKDEQRVELLQRVAAGERVQWEQRGDSFERGGSEAEAESATVLLDKVLAGDITPGRAWAGLAGASATKRQPRAARRVVKDMGAAIGKLSQVLQDWDQLDFSEKVLLRQKIENLFLPLDENAESDLALRAIRALGELRTAYEHINKFEPGIREELMLNAAALRTWLPSLDEARTLVETRRVDGKTTRVS